MSDVVPFLRVRDAEASAAWYARLGFEIEWTHRFDEGPRIGPFPVRRMICRPIAGVEMIVHQSCPKRGQNRRLDPQHPPDRRPREQFAANHTANGISGQAEYAASRSGQVVIHGEIPCGRGLCRDWQAVVNAEPDGLPRLDSHFVEHLTNPSFGQYGRHNISFCAVNPGPVRTERWAGLVAAMSRDMNLPYEEADKLAPASIPLGRIAEVEEVATLVVMLASPLMHMVNGTQIEIDGGQEKSLMDRLRDRK